MNVKTFTIIAACLAVPLFSTSTLAQSDGVGSPPAMPCFPEACPSGTVTVFGLTSENGVFYAVSGVGRELKKSRTWFPNRSCPGRYDAYCPSMYVPENTEFSVLLSQVGFSSIEVTLENPVPWKSCTSEGSWMNGTPTSQTGCVVFQWAATVTGIKASGTDTNGNEVSVSGDVAYTYEVTHGQPWDLNAL